MKRHACSALVATLLFLVTFPLSAHDEIKFEKGKKVRVMTQNLYVGASLFRILAPEEGNPFCDPDVTPLCIPATVDGIIATVIETDFEERAEKLAKQIKKHKPDLIGLQEVRCFASSRRAIFSMTVLQTQKTFCSTSSTSSSTSWTMRGLNTRSPPRVSGSISSSRDWSASKDPCRSLTMFGSPIVT